MTWLLSIILGYLPELWILAALASGALWLYGWIAPGRISAEIIRLGSLIALAVAVYLWTFAAATTAADARHKAAMDAERARQAEITAKAVDEARAAATAAHEARQAAESRLEVVLAGIPPDPPPPAKGYGGGLSPASVKSLLSLGNGK